MDKVKLGIIGVGNMGCGHIGNLLKDLVPEIELVAVADNSCLLYTSPSPRDA